MGGHRPPTAEDIQQLIIGLIKYNSSKLVIPWISLCIAFKEVCDVGTQR